MSGVSHTTHWHLRQLSRLASDQKLNFDAHRSEEAIATHHLASTIFSSAPSVYSGISQNESFNGEDVKIKTVTGVVDGDEVVFQLRENVTQRPTTDRTTRFHELECQMINNIPSRYDSRYRLWLMHLSFHRIKLYFVGVFMALAFIFAGLWFIQEGKCCDDPSMSYFDVFDFTIQTAATIGYGGYSPAGRWANFLVVVLSLLNMMLVSIYSGLIFFKFASPSAKIQFSDIMTLSNVNGLPCIELRVGNCDGSNNVLIDIYARMTYQFVIKYLDEKGQERSFGQTEELRLLSSRRHELTDLTWTLRHVIDEHSPLFGLDLLKPPGNSIFEFRVCLNATQKVTGSSVYSHVGYEVMDLMIGHRFVDQVSRDPISKKIICDFSKLNDTMAHPVWYPISRREVG
jgi:inward rectifier potassium channel